MSETYTCPECGSTRAIVRARNCGQPKPSIYQWICANCMSRGPMAKTQCEAVSSLIARHAERHDPWLPDLIREISDMQTGVLPGGDHVPANVVEWAAGWVQRINQQGTAPTHTDLSKIIGAIPDAPTREEMYDDE